MKANTVCKYSKCNLGKDGDRKKYYSCVYCAATENWKSMACCKEHYDLYIKEVLESRERGIEVDTLPERIDMTKEEIKKLKTKSKKQLIEETKEELKDYVDDNGELNIQDALDKINKEIDEG